MLNEDTSYPDKNDWLDNGDLTNKSREELHFYAANAGYRLSKFYNPPKN